ncbi:Zn(2)-C6 fungal-type domain-containing protein [Mycena chlorophos]|uniref:Zn(2)-C6 fungal-type domain-containing protein n=1 Tax=Mycena chlorophos TaxID=658473 RepID=A0A8H6T0R3_MYCCL|nr:Zn(2)-C6 fungal-type domain-containing protein [Mycena chlorophos]
MAQMGERIRQLESAFQRSGASTVNDSRDSTPAPAWLYPPEQTAGASAEGDVLPKVPDETFLTIFPDGEIKYFGSISSIEGLLSIVTDQAAPEEIFDSTRAWFSPALSDPVRSLFSSAPGQQALTCKRLFEGLPNREQAWDLIAIYYRDACWPMRPILQDEAAELLRRVYDARETTLAEQDLSLAMAHGTVVYLLLAHGALNSVDLPESSPEADAYFELACAAMANISFQEEPSVLAIQALTLFSLYYLYNGPRFSIDSAWATIAMACTVSNSVKLHRASSFAKLDPLLAHRQQALFWDMYVAASLQGIYLGQPLPIPLSSIDCPFPLDQTEEQPFFLVSAEGRVARWRLAQEVAGPASELFRLTDLPSYGTIVDFDERIRRCIDLMQAPSISASNVATFADYIDRGLPVVLCKIILMCIHTRSLTEMLSVDHLNPLETRYAGSFLAGYRAASDIIAYHAAIVTRFPAKLTLSWTIWKSLFHAAVVVGAIALRLNHTHIGVDALRHLNTILEVFENAARFTERAKLCLGLLRRLRDRATFAVDAGDSGPRAEDRHSPASEEEHGRRTGHALVDGGFDGAWLWPASDRSASDAELDFLPAGQFSAGLDFLRLDPRMII